MLAVVFLAAYGIARGTAGLMLAGVVLLAAGFFLGYRMEISTTLADRVRMWQSPWDNVARGGDQIAQALWSMSTGGLFGTGIGLGDTRYLPAGHTDLVLAAVGEELGFTGLLAVGLVYFAMIARALATARRATTDYAFFLATVLALFLAVPVLLMASGTLGIVPLTGVVTPFLSFGGSAMLANFAALGLLAAIRSDKGPPADLQVFRAPVRLLGGSLGACRRHPADRCGSRPGGQRGRARRQAASRRPGRRHAAVSIQPARPGPRAPDSARDDRGSRGAGARHGRPRGAAQARGRVCEARAVAGLGLSGSHRPLLSARRARVSPARRRRHAHELERDATRRSWSATARPGCAASTIIRHRSRSRRGTARRARRCGATTAISFRSSGIGTIRSTRPSSAVMGQRRELRLTIDGRLQVRVAAILAEYARRSSSGRAAAVVLDPATGDLLASVSYPWPSDADLRYGGECQGDGRRCAAGSRALRPVSARLDVQADDGRGRPAARLGRRRPDLHLRPPARRSRRRAGARLRAADSRRRDGSAPARNDRPAPRAGRVVQRVLRAARRPRSGRSPCSTWRSARRFRSPSTTPATHIRDTLPQIGYGQGEVVASPLRMARLTAAIAADGVIRDVRLESTAPAPAAHELLPAETARTLGRFMRDVVLDGTGRSLRGSATPIAGKTGTAEVAGAPSHSWFVGFAPSRPQAVAQDCRGGRARTRRIWRRGRGAGGRRDRRGRRRCGFGAVINLVASQPSGGRSCRPVLRRELGLPAKPEATSTLGDRWTSQAKRACSNGESPGPWTRRSRSSSAAASRRLSKSCTRSSTARSSTSRTSAAAGGCSRSTASSSTWSRPRQRRRSARGSPRSSRARRRCASA